MGNLGTNRQGVESNTGSPPASKKQPNRRLYYAFTLFNYEVNDLEKAFRQRLSDISNKFLYGREVCPTTSSKHLQGFCALKKPMRLTELKLPGNPHLEPCYAAEFNNLNYCSKDNDSIVSKGFPKPVDILNDNSLYTWQSNLVDVIKSPPDTRKIYWVFEELGNTGKSSFVKYCVVKFNALFCDGGKKSDIINLVFNNNMDECNLIIWDIPRCNFNGISYSALESIKNGLVCNTKYETGVKLFNPPHIIVFANSPPEVEKLSMDRWQIYNIQNKELKHWKPDIFVPSFDEF